MELELTQQGDGTFYYTADGIKSDVFSSYKEMKSTLSGKGIEIPNKSQLKWFSAGWFEKYAFINA